MSSEQQTTERSPEEIRAEIQQTRAELGDTAAAIAEKADVKAQAKHKVEDVKAQAKAKVGGAKAQVSGKTSEIGGKVHDAAPESAGDAAQRVQRFASENPVPLAVGGAFVAGVAIGRRLSR